MSDYPIQFRSESNISDKIKVEDLSEYSPPPEEELSPEKFSLRNQSHRDHEDSQIKVISQNPTFKLYESNDRNDEEQVPSEKSFPNESEKASASQKSITQQVPNKHHSTRSNKISEKLAESRKKKKELLQLYNKKSQPKVESPQPKQFSTEKYESPLKKFLRQSPTSKYSQKRGQSLLESFQRSAKKQAPFEMPHPQPLFNTIEPTIVKPERGIIGDFSVENVPHKITDTLSEDSQANSNSDSTPDESINLTSPLEKQVKAEDIPIIPQITTHIEQHKSSKTQSQEAQEEEEDSLSSKKISAHQDDEDRDVKSEKDYTQTEILIDQEEEQKTSLSESEPTPKSIRENEKYGTSEENEEDKPASDSYLEPEQDTVIPQPEPIHPVEHLEEEASETLQVKEKSRNGIFENELTPPPTPKSPTERKQEMKEQPVEYPTYQSDKTSEYYDEGSELVNDYEPNPPQTSINPQIGYRSTEYHPENENDYVYLKKSKVNGFDRKSKTLEELESLIFSILPCLC